MINWSRIVRHEFAAAKDVQLQFVDTAMRYRKIYDRSRVKRLVGGAAQALRDTGRVRRQLRAGRPDVFHLCTFAGLATLKDILMLRAARRRGVPAVVHYHTGRLPDVAAKKGLEWRFLLRAMRLAAAVVTVDTGSEAAVRRALPGHRVVTLPNMVEIDAVDAIRREASVQPGTASPGVHLVYVGHVLPSKGLPELIAAAARLQQRGVILDIVGPAAADYRAQLLGCAAQCGPTDWLRFHGGVDHATAIRRILAADVLVLPSHSEGAPLVVLEAMACGKPIVSCPVGSVPAMLDIGGPQECGVCVPCRDVDALTEALDKLGGDPERRKTWGAVARRRVEQHYAAPLACARLAEFWRCIV